MTGPNQVGGQTWPSSGTTGWDVPLKANVDAIRQAHNAADTAAADAAAAAAGKYTKPGSGIPKSDLAAAVAASLDKADSALQSLGYANAVAGSRFDVIWDGVTLPARPSNRADIGFDITGPLPLPTQTQMTTGGYLTVDNFVERG